MTDKGIPKFEYGKPSLPPKPAHLLQHGPTDNLLTENATEISRCPQTVTSASYELDEFEHTFLLPQLVRVSAGCYGDMEQSSICKDDEIMLLFTKVTKTVVACRGKEKYDIPLNSTFAFSPYNENSESSCRIYGTIKDLLVGNKDIPAVVKVLKSYKGKTKESSVVAGSLIFPKKMISSKQQNVLECTSDCDDTTLLLELSCAGNFSIHPNDMKMSLMQYISNISIFPVKVKIFNSRKYSEPGADFVLDRRRAVHSYICTTDILGEKGYPIFELPMQTPISVQCIKRDDVDMSALLNKASMTYANFNLSLISGHFVFCEKPSYTEMQKKFYTKVDLLINDASHYYDLTKPTVEPGLTESNVYVYMSPLHGIKKNDKSSQPPPTQSPTHKLQAVTIPQDPHVIAKENKAYLKSLAVTDVLKILDTMELSQYKDRFKKEKVDGMLLETLTARELKEVGVSKSIHQKRLLFLIDGKVSAKQFLEDEHVYDYINFSPHKCN